MRGNNRLTDRSEAPSPLARGGTMDEAGTRTGRPRSASKCRHLLCVDAAGRGPTLSTGRLSQRRRHLGSRRGICGRDRSTRDVVESARLTARRGDRSRTHGAVVQERGYDRSSERSEGSMDMAIVEANPNLGASIVADAKEYVLYSWSVQDQINPIAVAGAEGRHFWDYDGKRYLDFASQLVNVNIGHQHPKIIQAIKDQADQLCTIGPPMANESRSRLGRMLAEVTPGRPVRLLLHERRRGGERERRQARAPRDGTEQDHRAVSLVPRRDERRRDADRRPAPLGGRAGDARRGADVRPVHVPLPGRSPRPLSGLHGRAAPRGDPRVRGRAHGRGRHPRDRHGDERRSSRRPRATCARSVTCATATGSC